MINEGLVIFFPSHSIQELTCVSISPRLPQQPANKQLKMYPNIRTKAATSSILALIFSTPKVYVVMVVDLCGIMVRQTINGNI
jgi:hypothetical protein